MLQRPIPVVVVIRAEMVRAAHNVAPSAAIEREAHVVFAADPGNHLNLLSSIPFDQSCMINAIPI